MATTKRPTWERTGVPGIYKQQGRSPRDPRYRVAWRDAAGRPQATTFGSWDAAQGFKAEHRVARNNGQQQDAVLGRTTFAEFWPHYMRVAGPAASGSKAQYERLARIHILPTFGEMQMADIRPRHISAFQAKLREAGRAITTNHAMRVLNRALRIAVREEYIPRHPGLGIEVDRPGKRVDVRFMGRGGRDLERGACALLRPGPVPRGDGPPHRGGGRGAGPGHQPGRAPRPGPRSRGSCNRLVFGFTKDPGNSYLSGKGTPDGSIR